MQLAGDGVFGPPRDRDEALRVLRAAVAAVNLRVTDPSETPGRRFDAQLTALAAAREEGLIDGIGLSNVSRRHLLRAAAQTEIVCVQNLFNLADQRSQDVLAECAARDIAFVPFCPLGLPGGVRRRLLADPVLAALAARLGATPVQVALAWLLDLAPNILLIPGTRTRAHLAENLGAASIRLDDAARAELTRHFPAAQETSP
jgi:aryl-alcohol dehydrogenase-like predicted oxidoreductase